jgi:hypothetical protein
MSLHWNIIHDDRLMVVVADGPVARQEIDRMLDDMVAEGALGYRKLFDGSQGDTSMSPSEILDLGVRMRSLHQLGTMGPLAVIVPDDKWGIIARVLGMLAAARRPMRVFQNTGKARRWLERQDLASPTAGLPTAVTTS